MSETQRGLRVLTDLADERAFVDHAYRCLDAMRRRAIEIKDLGYLGGNVTEGGVEVHDVQQWELDKQRRIDALQDTGAALCFGRIDRATGERWHIGRRHVEDAAGEPVVTDWRASVATPFYRATVADPMGLTLRRRFLIEGRSLVDLFDEDLADPTAADAGAYVPDPLLAEVSRTRTGEMRDIVATIQAEQDVIIRAPLEECIVVQGGPGTGKTAVGLHRAAFLLYEHRQLLERQRLLIVGPNRLFLQYISQVLPSLGEVASTQLTVEGLAGADFPVRGGEPPEVARVKGQARMATVIRRAALAQTSTPRDDLRVDTRYGTVVVPAGELAQLVETGRDRAGRIKDYRAVLRQALTGLAWRHHLEKATADVTDREGFEADARSAPELKAALDRMWPNLTAPGVIRRLYGHRPTLAEASAGILSPGERDLLARRPTPKLGDERWTRADLALLDEAEDVISGVSQRYGHIVVDEAQDLSAMELRMISRRSRTGSMTVLGDLAQATAPGGQVDWKEALEALGAPHARFEELTVGYRVPEPILAYANQLLPGAAPGVRPSTSVRRQGGPPRIRAVPREEIGEVAADEVRRLATVDTSIGVVVTVGLKDEIAAALRTAGIAFTDGQRSMRLGDHVTVLAPSSTKGVEFDAVVAVEPGRIVGEEGGSLRLLYVVLTRAVQHLSVIHSEPLPEPLRR